VARPDRVPRPPGFIQGATYADVHGRMPAALLLILVPSSARAAAAWQAFSRRNWPIPVAFGLYFVVSIGGEMYSTALQRFVVSPNEQVRERRTSRTTSTATRRAFNLDRIENGRDLGRRDPHAERHREQPGHARQRAPLGSSAAARHVRPAPGDPHVLRLRLGGQRPVP
jgi:uncharacterized membrane protein (UPF0182 family)